MADHRDDPLRSPRRRPRRTREYRTRLLGLALAAVVASVSAQEAPELPIAVVQDAIHDFGEVEAGAELRHVFEVGNLGQVPLKIHRVDSTCACTVAGFDAQIDAGKVGRIQVELATDGQEGPFAVHLHAYTSDPNSPELTLTLKADVKVGLQARPGFVRFVVATGFEDPLVDTQIVVARDGEAFSIQSVNVRFPFLTASFREATSEERRDDASGPQWAVEVRLLPAAPEGPFTGVVEILTDHSRQDVLVLPLNGFVHPVFEVHPDIADLGSFDASGAHRTSVRVRSRVDTQADAIVSAETDVEGIEIEIVKDDRDSDLYFVVLRTRPRIAAGTIDGILRIHTASGVVPVIEMPLRGIAR